MEPLRTPRCVVSAVVCVALAAGVSARVARANELGSTFEARDLVVHDAATVLSDHCSWEDGRLWFLLPGGPRYELITSTTDPDIVNPGDGAFHPFDVAEIQAAIAQVRYPLRGVAAEIFVLPFPRRGQLQSAAGAGLILLAPGVRPLRREQQHAELVHELGHVVQYANLPDGDPRWDAYRRLRSIQDEQRFGPASIHADRPHEIFAEDFRALFGGAAATYSGTIENDTLTPPAQIAGLDAFMIALAGPGPDQAFSAWPNPSSGMLHFSWEGGAAVPLDVFDAAGRRVATIAPETRWGSIAWSLDAAGLAQTTGGAVVYARPRGARGLGVRVVLMPRR